jgi:hypothetical protein
MKFTAIAVIFSAVVLGGCSTNRAYRPGMTGGSGGASGIPDSRPSLGLPTPTFRGQDNPQNRPEEEGHDTGQNEADCWQNCPTPPLGRNVEGGLNVRVPQRAQ